MKLTLMLAELGYRVTLCPYTRSNFWSSVYEQANQEHPALVDRVYLQVYAGGTGNSPRAWNRYFDGLQVEPGLWCKHGSGCRQGDAPSTVHSKMSSWRGAIAGGWMWLLDDMLKCGDDYPIEDYAAAINTALQ